MASYCVCPNDTFWSECKIVPPPNYNRDDCGVIKVASIHRPSYNSELFPSENSCVSEVSSELNIKFVDETGRPETISTKRFTNYQQTRQHGCTRATSAFPIFEDAAACTVSHASNFRLLNKSRCPLGPVNCNDDNAQNYKIKDFNQISAVSHVHSNYGLSEATHETGYPEYYSQSKCESNIKQILETLDGRYPISTINSYHLLGTKVPDSYHLPTSSADTTIANVPDNNDGLQTSSSSTTAILKGKKIRRHIPHFLRPQDFVDRRNSRERKRIGSVNEAFEVLRRHIPSLKQKEGASKINILRFATEYIRDLGSLL